MSGRVKNRIFICLLLVFASLAVCVSCSRGGSSKNDDKGPWSLPSEGGTVTAQIISDGEYLNVLKVSGSGRLSGFESAKDAPWYSVAGKISQISLSEGIEYIGKNTFADCVHVKTVILPSSLTGLDSSAFSPSVSLCVREDSRYDTSRRVYRYSAEKPVSGGYFWHEEGGYAKVWEVKRILFIGNSFVYTNDIDRVFADLAAAAGVNVVVERITIGAHNLSQFADPADEGGARVERALSSASDYDIIILQEQSTRPITNYDLFSEGAEKLRKRIAETQDHCKVYLYATWGYPPYASSTGTTVEGMEAKIRDAYTRLGSSLGLEVVPVGEAFTEIYRKYPAINLYEADNKHPSYAGALLSASVHLGKLLGIEAEKSGYTGYRSHGLSDADAAVLMKTAFSVLKNK